METLRFDTLKDKLLLKNGNYLYKVPYRDGHAVLKVWPRKPLAKYRVAIALKELLGRKC